MIALNILSGAMIIAMLFGTLRIRAKAL